MIIRIREYKSGGVVQCIRTTYDPATKRGRQEVVATFKEYLTPNEKEVSRLESDEREQLDDWLKAKRKAQDEGYARNRPAMTIDFINQLVHVLNDDKLFQVVEPNVDADRLFDALDNLSKALRKRKIKRPPKPPKEETPIEKMIKESED
jgi:hypothetical protein